MVRMEIIRLIIIQLDMCERYGEIYFDIYAFNIIRGLSKNFLHEFKQPI